MFSFKKGKFRKKNSKSLLSYQLDADINNLVFIIVPSRLLASKAKPEKKNILRISKIASCYSSSQISFKLDHFSYLKTFHFFFSSCSFLFLMSFSWASHFMPSCNAEWAERKHFKNFHNVDNSSCTSLKKYYFSSPISSFCVCAVEWPKHAIPCNALVLQLSDTWALHFFIQRY